MGPKKSDNKSTKQWEKNRAKISDKKGTQKLGKKSNKKSKKNWTKKSS